MRRTATHVLLACATLSTAMYACEDRNTRPDGTTSTADTRTDVTPTDRTTTTTPSTTPSDAARPADNTGKNERDRTMDTPTPIDQSESAEDIRITADIRRAVTGDDALSMNAKNCKIITRAGVVTLRGPVASEAERAAIQRLASSTAGVTSVVNELEIAP